MFFFSQKTSSEAILWFGTSKICLYSYSWFSGNFLLSTFYLAGWVELFNPFRTLNTHMHSKASLMVNKHHSQLLQQQPLLFLLGHRKAFALSLGNKAKSGKQALKKKYFFKEEENWYSQKRQVGSSQYFYSNSTDSMQDEMP